MENHIIKMDELGVPRFFGNTHIIGYNPQYTQYTTHLLFHCLNERNGKPTNYDQTSKTLVVPETKKTPWYQNRPTATGAFFLFDFFDPAIFWQMRESADFRISWLKSELSLRW